MGAQESGLHGLFIDYAFCTGCHTCEVACKKALNLPEGQWGIRVLQDGPRQNPDGSWEYTYLPLPTTLCDGCTARVAEGRLPLCVHHCQAGVMEYGLLEELQRLQADAPRSVVYRMR